MSGSPPSVWTFQSGRGCGPVTTYQRVSALVATRKRRQPMKTLKRKPKKTLKPKPKKTKAKLQPKMSAGPMKP